MAAGSTTSPRSPASAERSRKAASKTKYTCPLCGANAWAKPSSLLVCGACHTASDYTLVLTMTARPLGRDAGGR